MTNALLVGFTAVFVLAVAIELFRFRTEKKELNPLMLISVFVTVFLAISFFSPIMSGLVTSQHLDVVSSRIHVPGTINVTHAPYSARGDGVTDDTVAITAAIEATIGNDVDPIIYFPAGTYLISDTLFWRSDPAPSNWNSGMTFQGQSSGNTTILLADNTFTDAGNPEAMIYTASSEDAGTADPWSTSGNGNTGFRNYVRDMTINTGVGNPGAVGIDYNCSNIGAIRNVNITSGDGTGIAGISLQREWPGPCLITTVAVDGFNVGVWQARGQYSMTLEHITLSNQLVAGILNNQNMLTVRDLTSTNTVSAIGNLSANGMIAIIDANLSGGDATTPAIDNINGEYYLRNITSSGYQTALRTDGLFVPGATVSETGSATAQLFPEFVDFEALTVKETATVAPGNLDTWTSMADYGVQSGSTTFNNSAALQAAIDDGATRIWFPPGMYLFGTTVTINNQVREIDFMNSWIGFTEAHTLGPNNPMFRIVDGTPSTVKFYRNGQDWSFGWSANGHVRFLHDTARTLVLQDAGGSVANVAGSGDLFIENVGSGYVQLDGNNVWARQLNIESARWPQMLNSGGKFWILGLKTEKLTTAITTEASGETEVIGGFLYGVGAAVPGAPADPPGFIATDSQQRLTFMTNAFSADEEFNILLEDTKGVDTREMLLADGVSRGSFGAMVPFYQGSTE